MIDEISKLRRLLGSPLLRAALNDEKHPRHMHVVLYLRGSAMLVAEAVKHAEWEKRNG